MQGVKVYLFTASGSYQGQSRVTDSSGEAIFNLPEQLLQGSGRLPWPAVLVRSVHMAGYDHPIPMREAEVTVTGSGSALAGVNVYVFSASGAYLGISGTTDSSGKAVFTLPAGSYKYRADYQTNQYWSGVEALIAGQTNPVSHFHWRRQRSL